MGRNDAAGFHNTKWVSGRWRMAKSLDAQVELRMGDFGKIILCAILCLVVSINAATEKDVAKILDGLRISRWCSPSALWCSTTAWWPSSRSSHKNALCCTTTTSRYSRSSWPPHRICWRRKRWMRSTCAANLGWALGFFVVLYVTSCNYVRRNYFDLLFIA